MIGIDCWVGGSQLRISADELIATNLTLVGGWTLSDANGCNEMNHKQGTGYLLMEMLIDVVVASLASI